MTISSNFSNLIKVLILLFITVILSGITSCSGSPESSKNKLFIQQLKELETTLLSIDSIIPNQPQALNKKLDRVDSFYDLNKLNLAEDSKMQYYKFVEDLANQWEAIPGFRRVTADLPSTSDNVLVACGSIDNANDNAKRQAKFSGLEILNKRLESFVVEIPVVFHIIKDKAGFGHIENIDDRLDEQIDYLNQAFSTTSIKFILRDYKEVIEDDWFHKSFEDNKVRFKMMGKLSVEPENTLNIFTVSDLTNSSGLASFPWDENIRETPLDGILLAYSTIPNIHNDTTLFDGSVLVHEVGHYLGLFHTFRMSCPNDHECPRCDKCDYDGCESTNALNGDLVEDTPSQRWCYSNCSDCMSDKKKCTNIEYSYCNTCPKDTMDDSMINFMGYNFLGNCNREFTSGQIVRMLDNISRHRKVFIIERKPYLQ